MVINMNIKQLAKELCLQVGVAGMEDGVINYSVDLLKNLGEVSVTPLGSVICSVVKPKENQPHIMLDAHIDEIGMIVTNIDDNGFLKVASCGGIDRRLVLSSQVTIHCDKQDIKGIICSIPPHLQKSDTPSNPKIDDIFVDVGYSREKALEIVAISDRVTIDDTPMDLLDDYICSKSLDDRAGCAVVIKAAEQLKNESINCGLTVVLSSMEEVGGQGAETATYIVNPTHAICVDVGFGHTPDAPKNKCGEMKKGPIIGFAPILNSQVCKDLTSVAKDKEIPYQLEAMGGATGTNADHIAVSRNGVKTGLISIPQKYMHTPIEVVSVQDMENSAKLIAEYIKEVF